MPTLSSLLVAREIATMRTVEEAIARQVLHGGDLATNLLEVASVSERSLTDVVASHFELEPAPIGKLPPPAAAVLRAIPGELALRHGIFPLERQGRALVLATSEPLPASIEEDMTFAMDLAIVQRVAPLVRIREAIAEHYGIPLDRRFLRLVAKLEGRPDPSPSSLPPNHRIGTVSLPRPASVPPATFGSGVPGSGRLPPGVEIITKTQPAPAPDGEVIVPVIPRTPVAPIILTPSPNATVGAAEPVTDAQPASEPPRGPPNLGTRALAGWLKRALIEARAASERPPPPAAARPERTTGRKRPLEAARGRRKGPYTLGDAEGDLADASTSDAVLDIVFTFARQFFEYAVLFVVHGDLAEGRDAAGPGADAAGVRAIGVPLDLPSMLSTARERRAPIVAEPQPDGLDAELSSDLGRADVPRRARAVLPVVVRSRTVALVFGDDGGAAVELDAIGEVVAVAGLATATLERLLVSKKRGGSPRVVAVGALADASRRSERLGGADALARTVGALEHASASSPPPGVSPGAASVPPPRHAAAVIDEAQEIADGISPAARSMRPGTSWPPVDSSDPPAHDTGIADEDSEDTIGKVISRVVEAAPPLPHDIVLPDKSAGGDGRLGHGDWSAATGDGGAASMGAAHPTSPAAASAHTGPLPAGAAEVADGRSKKATLRGFARPSNLPPAEREGPRSAPRGAAPVLEGRSRTPTFLGAPLPKNPPPNAVSTPSPLPPLTYPFDDETVESSEPYPLDPPPPTAAAVRPIAPKPIPREEVDEPTPGTPRIEPSPDVSMLVASSGSSPIPRAPVPRRAIRTALARTVAIRSQRAG